MAGKVYVKDVFYSIKFIIKVYEVICIYSIWNLINAIMNFNMHQSANKTEWFPKFFENSWIIKTG